MRLIKKILLLFISMHGDFLFCMQKMNDAASSGLGLEQIGISFASHDQQFCDALEQGNFQRCAHFVEHELVDKRFVIDIFNQKLIEMFDVDLCKAMIDHAIVDIKKVDLDAFYNKFCDAGKYDKCRLMVSSGLIDFNKRIEIFRKLFAQEDYGRCAQMAKEMVFVGRVYKILDYFDAPNCFLKQNFDCTLLEDIFKYAVAFEDKDLYKALHKAGLTERYQINNVLFTEFYQRGDFERCKFMLEVDGTLYFEPLRLFTDFLSKEDEKNCRIFINQKLISEEQVVAVFFEQVKAQAVNNVSFLLEKNLVSVDVGKRRADGSMYRPIHYAAYTGNLQMVKLLMQYAASINKVYEDERFSPLVSAIVGGNFSVVDHLLVSGALPENSLFAYVCYTQEDVKQKKTKLPLYKRLLEIGADINATDLNNGKTIVHKAASVDPGAYRYLSSIPTYDATIKDFYGQTATEIFEASEKAIRFPIISFSNWLYYDRLMNSELKDILEKLKEKLPAQEKASLLERFTTLYDDAYRAWREKNVRA